MNTIQAFVAIFLLATLEPLLSAQAKYPFQDNSLTTDQRIDNVLSLLTLQEKIDLLGKNLNVPRLGIYGSG
ncbi:MAG TPA: hypothetical protein VFC37_00060, partial [Terracidiphilus sp.]|nr:hypothetical protein [Terracidiphilus sp.]